jgi:hypothetical protein
MDIQSIIEIFNKYNPIDKRCEAEKQVEQKPLNPLEPNKDL